jgi:hypothetical protein
MKGKRIDDIAETGEMMKDLFSAVRDESLRNESLNRNKYTFGITLLKAGTGAAIYEPVYLSIIEINELFGKEKWVSGALQHFFENFCLIRIAYQESYNGSSVKGSICDRNPIHGLLGRAYHKNRPGLLL